MIEIAAEYKTIAGDVWDSIAKTVFGSEAYTSLLMANNQHLLRYFVFPAGITLVIPDKPEEETLLPEWRD